MTKNQSVKITTVLKETKGRERGEEGILPSTDQSVEKWILLSFRFFTSSPTKPGQSCQRAYRFLFLAGQRDADDRVDDHSRVHISSRSAFGTTSTSGAAPAPTLRPYG